jgi:Fic family protein
MYVARPPALEGLSGDSGSIGRVTLGLGNLVFGLTKTEVSLPREYVHWDKLRHLTPPDGFTAEKWWLAIKLARLPLLRPLPLKDPEGLRFAYTAPDEAQRLLHLVDQTCSGAIAMPEVVTADEQARSHYLVNSLMEEAIRSSQLEGASTSRQAAKELLRSGREPTDRSERMILNNYRALQFMREEMTDELTPEIVLELQRVLTEGTLDDPSAAGRLQTPDDDRIAVFDNDDGSLLHRPPPADQLVWRLNAMCEFANGRDDSEGFVHPVMRAILLHFWLAYDHPFEDGNGRTARALFYWSMRTQGYWLAEYLSISGILRDAPSQYARSFLLTETDDRDTTYFVLYQLQVIERAIAQLHDYLERKVGEIRQTEALARGAGAFNHRQLALIGDAMRNPERTYTFRSHARSHDVTTETGRADLLALECHGLLVRRKLGRRYAFSPAADFARRLQSPPQG